jgi:hypothetical protein
MKNRSGTPFELYKTDAATALGSKSVNFFGKRPTFLTFFGKNRKISGKNGAQALTLPKETYKNITTFEAKTRKLCGIRCETRVLRATSASAPPFYVVTIRSPASAYELRLHLIRFTIPYC